MSPSPKIAAAMSILWRWNLKNRLAPTRIGLDQTSLAKFLTVAIPYDANPRSREKYCSNLKGSRRSRRASAFLKSESYLWRAPSSLADPLLSLPAFPLNTH